MSQREQNIQQEILLAIGTRPDCRVWRINAGQARSLDGKRIIKGAPPGHPDIAGILADGRWLGLEGKRPGERQSEGQRNFQRMIEGFGGVYLVARSAEEAIRLLDSLGLTEEQ